MPGPEHAYLVVLVDDVRSFRDGRPCLVARTAEEAVALLDGLADRAVDELWLDYELGGGRTIRPVVEWLESLAAQGQRPDIGVVYVHTSSVTGAVEVMRRLRAAGYAVERHRNNTIWSW